MEREWYLNIAEWFVTVALFELFTLFRMSSIAYRLALLSMLISSIVVLALIITVPCLVWKANQAKINAERASSNFVVGVLCRRGRKRFKGPIWPSLVQDVDVWRQPRKFDQIYFTEGKISVGLLYLQMLFASFLPTRKGGSLLSWIQSIFRTQRGNWFGRCRRSMSIILYAYRSV